MRLLAYLWTKWKLYNAIAYKMRLEERLQYTNGQIASMQNAINAGFISEAQFAEHNKKLIENRKRQSDPEHEKELEKFRKQTFPVDFKPKKRFKDSKDKNAIKEGEERSGYFRVLAKRPLKQDTDALVDPSTVRPVATT